MTTVAKSVSILLPILFICLLRIESVQHSTIGFLIIANILSKFLACIPQLAAC